MGDVSPENTVVTAVGSRFRTSTVAIWNNCGNAEVYASLDPGKWIYRRDGTVFRVLVKLSAGFSVPVYFLLHYSIVVILDLPLPALLNGFIMVSEWCLWGLALPHTGLGLKAALTSHPPTASPALSPPHRWVPLCLAPEKPSRVPT